MAETGYGKNFVRKPSYESGRPVKGRQIPVMTLMSNKLVPGCNKYVELGWIYEMPEPNPHIFEHRHDYAEIVLYIGGNPAGPEDLGAEIEYYVGGQPLTFNTTSAIYIPRGVKHGPVTWKKFARPHLELSILLGPGDSQETWNNEPQKGLPQKTDRVDYEKYIVRKPIYLPSTDVIKALGSPAGIYVSDELIPGCNNYIDFGWIYGMPEPNPPIPEHDHDFEEIVLNIGSDPHSPESLGAELEFSIDGQACTFNTTTAIYAPKGIKHGPMIWKKHDRPHLLMPVIIGAGSLAQAAPAGQKVDPT